MTKRENETRNMKDARVKSEVTILLQMNYLFDSDKHHQLICGSVASWRHFAPWLGSMLVLHEYFAGILFYKNKMFRFNLSLCLADRQTVV